MQRSFIALDLDNAGQKIGQATLMDDLSALHDASLHIEAGIQNARHWVESKGGTVIDAGGDELRAFGSPELCENLEELKHEIELASGFTVTIGCGNTLSQAEKALIAGKFSGKNKVMSYPEASEEIEHIISNAKEQGEMGGGNPNEQKEYDHYLSHMDESGEGEMNPENEDYSDEDMGDEDYSDEDYDMADYGDMEDMGDEDMGDYGDEEEIELPESDEHEEEEDDVGKADIDESAPVAGEDPTTNAQDNREADAKEIALGRLDESHDDRMEDMDDEMPEETDPSGESVDGEGEQPEGEAPDYAEMAQDVGPEKKEELKQRIAQNLEMFKQNKDLIDQIKGSNPELYQSMIGLLQNLIEAAKGLQSKPAQKSEKVKKPLNKADKSDKYNYYIVHKATGEIHGGNEFKSDAVDASKDQREPASAYKVMHHSKVDPKVKEDFHRRNKIMGMMNKAESGLDEDHDSRMAGSQLDQITHHIKELLGVVDFEHDDLPDWVKSKITRAANDIADTSHFLQHELGHGEHEDMMMSEEDGVHPHQMKVHAYVQTTHPDDPEGSEYDPEPHDEIEGSPEEIHEHIMRHYGPVEASSYPPQGGRDWYTTVDPHIDMHSGEHSHASFHVSPGSHPEAVEHFHHLMSGGKYKPMGKSEMRKAKFEEGMSDKMKISNRDQRNIRQSKETMHSKPTTKLAQASDRILGVGLPKNSMKGVNPSFPKTMLTQDTKNRNRNIGMGGNYKESHKQALADLKSMPKPDLPKSEEGMKKKASFTKMHEKLVRQGYSKERAAKIAGSIKAKYGLKKKSKDSMKA